MSPKAAKPVKNPVVVFYDFTFLSSVTNSVTRESDFEDREDITWLALEENTYA